ncbi:MAG: hypothetical protein ACPGXK_10745 [Phycisphaerae bacterium]
MKVYDVRDLLTLIDPPVPVEIADNVDASRQQDFMIQMLTQPSTSTPDPAKNETRSGKLESLIDKLCFSHDLQCDELLPGVYMAEGVGDSFEDFERMLQAVRNLYGRPYELALIWYRVASTDDLTVGEVVEQPKSLRRHHMVVFDNTPIDIRVGTTHTYVADLTAVVAQNSAMHEPVIGTIHDGLFASVVVSNVDRESETVLVRISGEFRDVSFPESASRKLEASAVHGLQLPIIKRRTLSAAAPVDMGKWTVVDIVDDFSEDANLVLAARIMTPGG